jgi:hypothetical protein
VLWLREGDTPTKFFHAHVNAWRCQNFIHSLEYDGNSLFSEEAKADTALEFYEQVLARPAVSARRIKLDQIDLPHPDLSGINSRFTEEEVWSVIRSLPLDKALGSDGFTVRFLQTAWPVFRHDVMCAFDAFWSRDTRDFYKINEASMTLIPKTSEAKSIKDYRPISLIYVVSKLFSKMLVNRLSQKLHDLVHISQSAFIHGWFIQVNFIGWSKDLSSCCMSGRYPQFC